MKRVTITLPDDPELILYPNAMRQIKATEVARAIEEGATSIRFEKPRTKWQIVSGPDD